MHDSLNLAWKLNLVIRSLAKPSLLFTYEEERRKIANDLIDFDVEHCKAFEQGEAALTKNFDENIRFISGIGAEYSRGVLSRTERSVGTPLRPGSLQIPSQVTRFIDANTVNIELDVPMLSQFRIYFVVPNVEKSLASLSTLCDGLTNHTTLGKATKEATQSYSKAPRRLAPADDFIVPERYTAVSETLTCGTITRSARSEFEIADLPQLLQDSRWTLYLDDVDSPSLTEKWVGNIEEDQLGIVIVRPDGYCGAIDTWGLESAAEAGRWIENYFSFML